MRIVAGCGLGFDQLGMRQPDGHVGTCGVGQDVPTSRSRPVPILGGWAASRPSPLRRRWLHPLPCSRSVPHRTLRETSGVDPRPWGRAAGLVVIHRGETLRGVGRAETAKRPPRPAHRRRRLGGQRNELEAGESEARHEKAAEPESPAAITPAGVPTGLGSVRDRPARAGQEVDGSTGSVHHLLDVQC